MRQDDFRNKRSKKGLLFFGIILILVVVIGWHIILPAVGVTLATGTGLWSVLVSTMVILSVSIVLALVLSGIAVLVISLIALAWVIIALAMFPFLFPIVVPILIVFLLISYLSRRRNR